MKLYTIDCPACMVLEKKLNAKGIAFERIDARISNPKNMSTFPQLELDDGKILNMGDATRWLKEQP